MPDYVLAIDQGTTSSRAMIFDHGGRVISTGQLEHDQIFPRAGWVEHNPDQIWANVREAVGVALTRANLTFNDIAAVGITNQRETAVVWDRTTGQRIVVRRRPPVVRAVSPQLRPQRMARSMPRSRLAVSLGDARAHYLPRSEPDTRPDDRGVGLRACYRSTTTTIETTACSRVPRPSRRRRRSPEHRSSSVREKQNPGCGSVLVAMSSMPPRAQRIHQLERMRNAA